MAAGDVQNFVTRLNQLIPPWFGEQFHNLTAFLNGFATMDSFLYGMLQFVQQQMRIATATGNNLDLICCDFFEGIFERYPNMSDTQFRKLIQATLIQQQCTRQAMENALYNVTGYYPLIWEPFGTENGVFFDAKSFFDEDSFFGGLLDPYNFWIEVFVPSPSSNGTAFFDGINTFFDGNLTTQSFYAASESTIWTYDMILAIVNRVKVGGTVPHLTLTFV